MRDIVVDDVQSFDGGGPDAPRKCPCRVLLDSLYTEREARMSVVVDASTSTGVDRQLIVAPASMNSDPSPVRIKLCLRRTVCRELAHVAAAL